MVNLSLKLVVSESTDKWTNCKMYVLYLSCIHFLQQSAMVFLPGVGLIIRELIRTRLHEGAGRGGVVWAGVRLTYFN